MDRVLIQNPAYSPINNICPVSLVWLERWPLTSVTSVQIRHRVLERNNMENDYQRPEGCPEPEGGTALRSPYPGWLRNYCEFNGWCGLTDVRLWKATILIHILERENKEKK